MKTPPIPHPRRRWPRIVVIAALLAVAALVGLYFWVTSDGFVRRFVWGAIAAQTGCEVTSGEIDFNLFSHFGVSDLRLTGPAPQRDSVTVRRADVRYDLAALLRGAVHLRGVTVEGVEASLTRRGDSTLALLADAEPAAEKPREPEGEGAPLRIDALSLSDITVHWTDLATGLPEPLEIEVALDALSAGPIDSETGVSDLRLKAHLESARQGDHTRVTGGTIEGRADVLMQRGGPISAEAQFTLQGLSGSWRGTSLDDLVVALVAKAQTDAGGVARITDTGLELRRGETPAGALTVAGEIDTRQGEGQLTVGLSGINDDTLELLMARPGGVDFGRSRAEGQVEIGLGEGGRRMEIDARVRVRDLSALAPAISQQRTPPLELDLAGSAVVDQAQQTLRVMALDASGDLENRRLFTLALDQPITLALGPGAAPEAPPARVSFDLQGLDLGRIRPLLPPRLAAQVRGGVVNTAGLFDVAEGGQALTATGRLHAERLVIAPDPAGDALPPLGLSGDYDVSVDLPAAHLAIRQAQMQVTREGREPGSFDVAGDLDFRAGEGTLQIRAENFDLTLPALALSDPEVWTLTAGTLDTDTVLTLAEGGRTTELSGQTAWSDLALSLAALGPQALPWQRGRLEIEATRGAGGWNLAALTVNLGEQGSLTASGQIDADQRGQFTVRLANFDLAAVSRALGDTVALRVEQGQVSGQTDVTVRAAQTLRVAFDGTAELGRWRHREAAEALPPLAARAVLTAEVAPDGPLVLDPLRIALTSNGQPWGEAAGSVRFDRAAGRLVFDLAGAMPGADAGRFSARADMTLEPLAGTAQVGLERAALGPTAAILADPDTAAKVADVVADGDQRLEFDLGASRLSAVGELTLSGLRPAQGEAVTVSVRNSVAMTPETLNVTDTGVSIQAGRQPPGAITVAAAIDRTGARESTVDITGQRADLTPLLDLLPRRRAAGGEQRSTSDGQHATRLPDLPDPGALRLRGTLRLEEVRLRTLEILQPRMTLTWARPEPATPNWEMRLEGIDAQIAGPRNTGRLTGAMRLAQGERAPLSYSLDLQTTKTDLDAIVPVLAPNLVDKLTGSFTLETGRLTGRGQRLPDDLSHLQGLIVLRLTDGEFRRIPLISRLAELTRLGVFERLQFFEGGVTLVPEGDHLRVTEDAPFWVRGDLTLLTAAGEVYYRGEQRLTLRPAIRQTVPIPEVGDLLARLPGGVVFPTNAAFPEYRNFPLSIVSSGTWADPRLRPGAPLIEEGVGELLPEGIEIIRERLPEIPGLDRVIPGRGDTEAAPEPPESAPGTAGTPETATPEPSRSPLERLEEVIPGVGELPPLPNLGDLIPRRR